MRGDKKAHLIVLDKPFDSRSLKRSLAVRGDSFFSHKVIRECCLLGLVASIRGGLPTLLGVTR